jgi:hypothetical protein
MNGMALTNMQCVKLYLKCVIEFLIWIAESK